ncbi:MAG: hypothetical protein IKE46_02390 [Selenomonadaceae bacterium]|nr:hypothetical protein [Selenomonadaceae bacterium]
MSKIYELFGYPVTAKNSSVKEFRRRAFCPFMSATCDGGGNRFQSEINLSDHPELQNFFSGMEKVSAGICSIQIRDDTPPWIICPRRLFYMGKNATPEIFRGETQTALLNKCNFPKGAQIGVWSELKIKYSRGEENPVTFDYTFDYVLMPLATVTARQAAEFSNIPWSQLKRVLAENNYVVTKNNSEILIENFPVGAPVIVEVMTSSTSGGNKKFRTTIPQSFEDCILGRTHNAPGINYRQVWARMASQLLVKSQAATEWGGIAIWIVQDTLADYISSSTALNLKNFLSETTSEVNILSFAHNAKSFSLYSGSIRPNDKQEIRPCFQDIILAAICPPRHVLISALCKKIRANVFIT